MTLLIVTTTTQCHLSQAGLQALPGLGDSTKMETGTMSIFPGIHRYFSSKIRMFDDLIQKDASGSQNDL